MQAYPLYDSISEMYLTDVSIYSVVVIGIICAFSTSTMLSSYLIQYVGHLTLSQIIAEVAVIRPM